ncbi:MAG: hypothetical protein ACRDSJ_23410 [Rubrobacteraceae bacterium]
MSAVYLLLAGASLVLIHNAYYEPAVSYVLFYLAASVGVTAFIAMILLPEEQFSTGFSGAMCVLSAAAIAMMTFFSGGLSSELYLLFLPLLMVAALHGSWRIGALTLVSVLFCYTMAIMPGLLNAGVDTTGTAPLVFYRLGVLLLIGAFALFSARGTMGGESEEDDYAAEATLQKRVEGELKQRRGVQVAVVLVDPGRDIDADTLLERVRARISDPIPLGEGAVFGFVLSGANDREVESAARRALAAASSLGAAETRAGAAIYPRDARSAGDLLVAAGQALEAAFEVESPSAIVISGGNTPRERRYRAAR